MVWSWWWIRLRLVGGRQKKDEMIKKWFSDFWVWWSDHGRNHERYESNSSGGKSHQFSLEHKFLVFKGISYNLFLKCCAPPFVVRLKGMGNFGGKVLLPYWIIRNFGKHTHAHTHMRAHTHAHTHWGREISFQMSKDCPPRHEMFDNWNYMCTWQFIKHISLGSRKEGQKGNGRKESRHKVAKIGPGARGGNWEPASPRPSLLEGESWCCMLAFQNTACKSQGWLMYVIFLQELLKFKQCHPYLSF